MFSLWMNYNQYYDDLIQDKLVVDAVGSAVGLEDLRTSQNLASIVIDWGKCRRHSR